MTNRDIDRRGLTLPDLRRMTQARVLLGRHGAGLPTGAVQAFLLDHARARQAVWSEIDRAALRNELSDLPLDMIEVESLATDRSSYVRRPDLGRLLSPASVDRLAEQPRGFDVAIVIGDGLSASAVAINAAPMARALARRFIARHLSLAPIVLAAHARVALADQVAELLEARIVVILIGERPGLSASDSLGIYITFAPATGTPDSRRNCISNVREGGLAIERAADAVDVLIADMRDQGCSGVALVRTHAVAIPGSSEPSHLAETGAKEIR